MELVASAVDELPEWVHRNMDNVEILVEDEPPDDECQPFDAGDLVVGRSDQVAEGHRSSVEGPP